MKRITRWYYQLLDVTQRTWSRFRETEVGKAIVWLTPRFFKLLLWLLLVDVALLILCYAALFFLVLVCTGNGKAAINSFTKIMLVVVGLFTAKQLVTHKAEVAKAIEVVAAP